MKNLKIIFFITSWLLLPYTVLSKQYTVFNKFGNVNKVNTQSFNGTEFIPLKSVANVLFKNSDLKNYQIKSGNRNIKFIPGAVFYSFEFNDQKHIIQMNTPSFKVKKKLFVPFKSFFYSLDSMNLYKVDLQEQSLTVDFHPEFLGTISLSGLKKTKKSNHVISLDYYRSVLDSMNKNYHKPKIIKKKTNKKTREDIIKDREKFYDQLMNQKNAEINAFNSLEKSKSKTKTLIKKQKPKIKAKKNKSVDTFRNKSTEKYNIPKNLKRNELDEIYRKSE